MQRFIHENAFKSVVCEMGAIMSRGRWVNLEHYKQYHFMLENLKKFMGIVNHKTAASCHYFEMRIHHCAKIQCGAIITRSIFFKILT